jgi:hypothetical protein
LSERDFVVIIKGIFYESVKLAETIQQVHRTTIRSRLKSPNPEWADWRYAIEEEKKEYLDKHAQSFSEGLG